MGKGYRNGPGAAAARQQPQQRNRQYTVRSGAAPYRAQYSTPAPPVNKSKQLQEKKQVKHTHKEAAGIVWGLLSGILLDMLLLMLVPASYTHLSMTRRRLQRSFLIWRQFTKATMISQTTRTASWLHRPTGGSSCATA